jgi:4-amino-4-deoxy-L-arabinose transferase-like glycosyltransferase
MNIKNNHNRINTFNVLFILFCIIGLLLRVWMLTLKDPFLRWDADWYYKAGIQIFEGKVPADCCFHGSGYPLFISLVSFLTSSNDPQIIRIAQIILDCFTGILLYISGKNLFGRSTGLTIFGLYMCNPLTASYTTLLMTEVVTIHIVSWLIYIVSLKKFMKHAYIWAIFGILLGLLFLIKPGFFWLIPVSILILTLVLFKKIGQKIQFAIITSCFSCFLFIIPLIFNNQAYGKPSIMPPYTLSIATQIYLTRYLPVLPETIGEDLPTDIEWQNVLTEYHYLINEKHFYEIDAFNKRYLLRVINMNHTDKSIIVHNFFRNFISFWNKRNLFLYIDLLYPKDKPYVQTGNFLLLTFFVIGLLYSVKNKERHTPVYVFMILFVLYGGIAFPLVSNLPRHSLPLYPIVFIFAGYGVKQIFTLFFHRTKNTYDT